MVGVTGKRDIGFLIKYSRYHGKVLVIYFEKIYAKSYMVSKLVKI